MDGLLQVVLVIGAFAALFVFYNYMERFFIRKVKREAGFATTATFTTIDFEKILVAEDQHGTTLIARVDAAPDDLRVETKGLMSPLSHNEYYWLRLNDGTHLPARAM